MRQICASAAYAALRPRDLTLTSAKVLSFVAILRMRVGGQRRPEIDPYIAPLRLAGSGPEVFLKQSPKR